MFSKTSFWVNLKRILIYVIIRVFPAPQVKICFGPAVPAATRLVGFAFVLAIEVKPNDEDGKRQFAQINL